MSDFSVILVFMALFVASMVSFSFMIRSVHYYKSMLTLYARLIYCTCVYILVQLMPLKTSLPFTLM